MTKIKLNNIKPSKLIQERDRLTTLIRSDWDKIYAENILKKGLTRQFDLKAILTGLRGMYDKLTIVKLRIQCINMGIPFKQLKQDANIINVYKLSGLNEYDVKIQDIMKRKTINPTLKAKKGKKNLSVTEELTFNYLRDRHNECLRELSVLRQKIADFNDNTDIEENDIPAFLAA